MSTATGPLPQLHRPRTLCSPINSIIPPTNELTVADTDPERIALFGSIALVPVSCRPGRYGLASTLFEILSFRPVRMKPSDTSSFRGHDVTAETTIPAIGTKMVVPEIVRFYYFELRVCGARMALNPEAR
jgi:hypothetical protein